MRTTFAAAGLVLALLGGAELNRVVTNSRGSRAWGLRGPGKERGGSRPEWSSTTSDAAWARNPHAPEGFRRRGGVCIVAAPRRCLASTSSRRLASDPAALGTRPTGVGHHPVKVEYPRYTTSGPLTRITTGAPIRDDFESAGIKEDLWRIWRTNPDRFQIEQADGRLRIRIQGDAGYNGLVSRLDLPMRDVVAVCRTGVESARGGLHAAIVHLCGSGLWSPDHWYEIRLRDHDGKIAGAIADVAVPPRYRGGYRGPYELPHPAKDGYLVKILCEGATNLCTGFVQVYNEWWQIGDPVEVPARRSRLEIKTAGADEGKEGSTIWFDDCRLYPRPETHYVTAVLVQGDGGPPGALAEGGDKRFCFDAGNEMIPGCDFTVELYASDGKTLVDRTTTGTAFGYAMLKLDRAPWDLYPAAAIIRVLLNGRQVGPDHRIESSGVEGLYPDDIYTIKVE